MTQRRRQTGTDERVELRVPSADLNRWRLTAGADGLTLSAWIRRICDEAAVDQQTLDAVKKKIAEHTRRGRK